jgi:aminopeptidase
MTDSRYTRLADLLTGYSTALKKGDKVLIDAFDIPDPMVVELIRAARRRGAIPYVQLHHARVSREIALGVTEESLRFSQKHDLARMKGMQAYIALRGAHNIFESSDVPTSKMNLAAKWMRPVLNWRVQKTRWVVLRWPTAAMAQQAGMSTEAFENFYFRVCTLDYARMLPGMKALKALMDRTDRVHIKGPGTDLRFSIRKIGSVMCGGGHNIPDGEVFTAPVRDSVEGTIRYNVPTLYHGVSFDGVELVFRKGRIVEAKAAQNSRRLNEILDSDEGARHIGEFALGFNPHILEPMRDILFDEKIAGSFHFTPGQAYETADNGNRSQVHWDMIQIQRKDHGGGEIWFDGKLIRKDGLFVPASLQKLNPSWLLKKS